MPTAAYLTLTPRFDGLIRYVRDVRGRFARFDFRPCLEELARADQEYMASFVEEHRSGRPRDERMRDGHEPGGLEKSILAEQNVVVTMQGYSVGIVDWLENGSPAKTYFRIIEETGHTWVAKGEVEHFFTGGGGIYGPMGSRYGMDPYMPGFGVRPGRYGTGKHGTQEEPVGVVHWTVKSRHYLRDASRDLLGPEFAEQRRQIITRYFGNAGTGLQITWR